jgi:predicted dehydrogenase
MSPIRVGFIGLSATQSWAVLAHLPFLQQTDLYEIVALCNSSLSSAQASIKAHKLPNSPSAYDKPEDLCADPNVDLVVISTRVDTHYKIAKAAILAGKDVFCEWPLASNHEQVAELAALARGKGVKTMIGLQGQKGTTIDKVKEIVDSGRLGDILSVNVAITTDLNFNGPLPPKSAYLVDRAIGGNQLTILTMHSKSSHPYHMKFTPLSLV